MCSQQFKVCLTHECRVPDVGDTFRCLVGIRHTGSQDAHDDLAPNDPWILTIKCDLQSLTVGARQTCKRLNDVARVARCCSM
jgi:hypothetical protein